MNGDGLQGGERVNVPRHYETVLSGDPRTVAAARHWTRRRLAGAGLPGGIVWDALTCVSELAANAVQHTASGRPGGSYRVVLEVAGDRLRVEVVDQGGDCLPNVHLGAGTSGRGLWICATLGVLQHAAAPCGGRRVWVDLGDPAAPVAGADPR